MAPIRRYLRITKYSVLEVRIYLDDPSQAESWLLDPRKDVLSRVMQAIRPFVLPKLREENERAKGKSKKAKGVKDVVSEEDFEVSMFLTETPTRHSLLTKKKVFKDKGGKIRSNSGKLTGWVTSGTGEADAPVTVREESEEEEGVNLMDIPEASAPTTSVDKRPRTSDANDGLFVSDEAVSEDEGFQTQQSPATKRARIEQQEQDDKKKLGLVTTYEGFSIYGRILCLIIKRRGYSRQQHTTSEDSSKHMMENWVSTQAAAPAMQIAD